MDTTFRHGCGHEVRGRGGKRLPERLAALRVNGPCELCRMERDARRRERDSLYVPIDDSAREERELESRRTEGHDALTARGFALEHTSESGSRYYALGGLRVRVSDHYVPLTEERLHNRRNGGRACCDLDIVLVHRRGVLSRDQLVREIETALDIEALA